MHLTKSLNFLKGVLVLITSQFLIQRTFSIPRRFQSGDIRLIGGSNRYEGTVLIYHNRRWGSICDRGWDIRDANVVCNQLGYEGALRSVRSSRFGMGRRRKWMSYLLCRGTESRLTHCRRPGWGIRYDYRYCSQRRRSAGVVCLPPQEPTTTRRPKTTSTPKSTTTTPEPTTTTSKPTTTKPKTTPKPTTTTTTPKSTTTTPKPTTTTPKPTTTTPKPTTTTPKPTTTTTTPKPTTTTPKPTTTTPKPTTPKPTTTTPKPTTTTSKPTTTTPKPTTTTPKPTTTTPKPSTTTSNEIDIGVINIDVDKTINEILDTSRYAISQNGRNSSSLQSDEEWNERRRTNNLRPSMITTKSPRSSTISITTTTTTTTTTTPRPTTQRPTTPKPTTPKPTTAKPTTPKPTTPRPTTSAVSSSNIVLDVDLPVGEWYRDSILGAWVLRRRRGGIRLAYPDRRLKKVTYEEYIKLRREKLGLPSDDHMKADDPQASGNRQPSEQVNTGTIQSNNSNSISISGGSSGSGNIDVVIGSPGSSQSQNNVLISTNRHRHRHRNRDGDQGRGSNTKLQIRRGGDRYRNRGRLEVLPPGKSEWGVICGDDWSIKETIVTCKHLRLGYAHQAVKTSQFGGHDMIKYYSSIKCTGRESRLQDCRWIDHEGPIRCKRPTSVAGIVCTRSLPDLVPSTEMLETTVFLQDRPLYYLQCAMEEKCLGASAYAIQGSRGWMSATRRLLRFSSVVANKGTADFKPALDRSQWEWHACHMHYHSMDIFAHYDIMDHYGNRVAEGLKASFCLEDSECNRGVFPKYNCNNYGQQGISVGCSDNYMADIDCQWIDITDLKAGKYKFKLEVNPNMVVAEISFENNVISCDLEYTGYNARIHNCDLKSLL